MGAGYGCGPEDEIRETARLASLQDEQEAWDQVDPSDNSHNEEYRMEIPGKLVQLVYDPSLELPAIISDELTQKAQLFANTFSFNGNVTYWNKTSYFDALWSRTSHTAFSDSDPIALMQTSAINRYGAPSQSPHDTVGYALTFSSRDEGEIAGMVLFPKSRTEVEFLHLLALSYVKAQNLQRSEVNVLMDLIKSEAQKRAVGYMDMPDVELAGTNYSDRFVRLA